MEEKMTAVVTGATAGIGLATAAALAWRGISVIGVGRSADKCERARETILAANPGAAVDFMLCDLSSQTQVRALARALGERLGRLDMLINNAGAVCSHFMTTEDGIELQLAVNHLAPFLLTHELLPLLQASPRGRVVTVSSGSHYGAKLDFDDLQMRRRYSCLGQYRRVKLCNVLFTAELNRRLGEGSAVRAFAADPGLVNTEIGSKGTSGIENLFWKCRRRGGADPSVPAACIAYLTTEPELSSAKEIYWKDCRPLKPNPYALRETEAKRLWEASERLCRITES